MSYNMEQKPGESLDAYYHRLAKVADQRLVRLERLANEEGYENAWKWAYNSAQNDIKRWGEGKRFNTAAPKNANQTKAKINDIQKFLQAKTSTKRGITNVYKKRAATFNEKYKEYGANFTWEDLADYYGKEKNKQIERYMASEVANKAIAVINSKIKKGEKLEDLQHLAWLRKNGGYEFGYTKTSGEEGQYDMIVDNAVHKILRSKKLTAEIYDTLLR